MRLSVFRNNQAGHRKAVGFQTAFVFMKVARLHAYDYAAKNAANRTYGGYAEQGVYPQDWAGIIEEGDFGE